MLIIIFLPNWRDQPSLDFGFFALKPWQGMRVPEAGRLVQSWRLALLHLFSLLLRHPLLPSLQSQPPSVTSLQGLEGGKGGIRGRMEALLPEVA